MHGDLPGSLTSTVKPTIDWQTHCSHCECILAHQIHCKPARLNEQVACRSVSRAWPEASRSADFTQSSSAPSSSLAPSASHSLGASPRRERREPLHKCEQLSVDFDTVNKKEGRALKACQQDALVREVCVSSLEKRLAVQGMMLGLQAPPL